MRSIGVSLFLLLITSTGCVSHSSGRGVRHIVQPGQTLYRIAKTYNVPAAKIAASNNLKNPTQIKVGQSLLIPGARYTRTVAVVPSANHAKVKPTTVRKTTPAVKASLPSKVKAEKVSPQVKYGQTSSSKSLQHKFIWPVQGKVVKKFNIAATVPSKGIDISAAIGTAVVCAAAGKVIYSGSGIAGFGHVIIIEHDSALYSVYGYNSKLLVSSGSYVSAGQKIALVGSSPHSKKGLLHFEVWQHKKAVDPAFYLK
ncbi:MAG: M23 family metallopeptidase [Desulfuromonas sp.]|nr:M23 family metallopeptidase [Desulfuromonas sp.]